VPSLLMQEDFVRGALGSAAAEAIVPCVVEKVRNFDGTCSAGVSEESHRTALQAMRAVQIEVIE